MSKTALYLALLLILASACEDQIVTGPEPKGSELSTSDEEPRQLLLGAESMPLIISELATERGLNTAGKTSAISALESARSAETATVHFPHVTSSYATGHASYTDYYYPNQSYASTGFTLRRTTAYTTSGGSGSGTYPLPSGIANAVGDTFDEYVSASIGGPSKAAGSKSDRKYVPFTPEPCRDLAQQCIGQVIDLIRN